MAEERVRRRLAAILAADVVGQLVLLLWLAPLYQGALKSTVGPSH